MGKEGRALHKDICSFLKICRNVGKGASDLTAGAGKIRFSPGGCERARWAQEWEASCGFRTAEGARRTARPSRPPPSHPVLGPEIISPASRAEGKEPPDSFVSVSHPPPLGPEGQWDEVARRGAHRVFGGLYGPARAPVPASEETSRETFAPLWV